MRKPHALCLPFPTQGHITPMLHLAKLLHSRGFHITFVNTEFNHHRLIKSAALDPTAQMDGFMFERIPDGLPAQEINATQSIPELCASVTKNCSAPLRQLVMRLNGERGAGGPPVNLMVRDAVMICGQKVADDLNIPDVVLWTMSTYTMMGFFQFEELVRRGYTPFTDATQFSNGYLNTPIDWIPSMPDICLKDLPTFFRTTDPNDIMLNLCIQIAHSLPKLSAIIINTLDELEHEIIHATAISFNFKGPSYAVGPIYQLLQTQLPQSQLHSTIKSNSNLWEEEMGCLDWLDRFDPASVVYVNFGSITVLTPEQVKEFAWGLANCNHPFVWVIRPDLVSGESAVLPPSFVDQTRERSLLAGWVPQKQVLGHPSIGAFLTHCGWNSMLESICSGVPMLCWPFFADQVTNCRNACQLWRVGLEMESKVRRDEVEGVVREMMEGEKGKQVKQKVGELKVSARKAIEMGGSSHSSFEKLVNDLRVMKR
ncbi:hypothetical protein AAC387_Pa04g2916 [Persea americana]